MKFQYIFLTFFGIIAVVAVVVFAKMPAQHKDPAISGAHGNVTIWGTFPNSALFSKVITDFNGKYQPDFSISYEFHDPKTFDTELVEALAGGTGPDIVLLPDDLILRHANKLETIPYTSLDQRTYKNLFVQASEIYMRDNGVLAVPFAIDPMVMYWNRSIFNSASLTQPPKYWDEFLTIAPKLIKRDPSGAITQSAISFGEYANVENAKDILAMLFLQVGNPIVDIVDGRPNAELASNSNVGPTAKAAVASALRYFMDFSNPLQQIYSWSRALPNSRDQFLNGKLAVYFDFASSYKTLQEKNPHLDFDIAPVPLPRTDAEVTFAHMYGLGVLKTSTNRITAFVAVQQLLGSVPSGDFAAAFDLPPVRRDLLSIKQTDAARSVFYDAAIRARTWLDPKPSETDDAFRTMVESVSSGRYGVEAAVSNLQSQLNTLLAPYQALPAGI